MVSDQPCPYCGHRPDNPSADRCDRCNGLFEPLSRKATQLAMGPWYIRDENQPFMPGISLAVLQRQIAADRVKADTVLRGPTTQQFWTRADQAPGVSRLLGKCHACGGTVPTDSNRCGKCSADLSLPDDVDRLGLTYTTPADRAHAKAEIDALRAGRPAPPPRDAPINVPVSSTFVQPDLLKPISKDHATTEHAEEDDHAGGFDPEAHDDAYPHEHDATHAEDLWDAAPTARRRRRRKGSNPAVIVLGVLLVCLVGGGLALVFSNLRHPGDDTGTADNSDSTTKSPPVIERTAQDVEPLSAAVLGEVDRMRQSGAVPDAFRERFDVVTRAAEQGQRDAAREDYTQAYASFAEARTLLSALEADIAAWQADQAAQAELAEARGAAEAARSQAESADGASWSAAAWAEGEAAIGQAGLYLQAERIADAVNEFGKAQAAYERALSQAEQGQQAAAAREALDASLKAGHSEQTLRSVASSEVDRMMSRRSDGERQMQSRDYEAAERSYNAALDLLRQAELAVERARYRKVYAFNAGYLAADLLIAIASGDGIAQDKHAALATAFEQLSLPTNPAQSFRPGDEADYAAAADMLVNTARDAIKSTHNAAAQASYNAGFQARIIGRTLETPAMTSDQQKRAHQSLNVLQDQASAAGWDVLAMRDAVEEVRAAIRNADLGKTPDRARQAWAALLKPMLDPSAALRLMDPVTPSTAPDPELFPGLGRTGA